MRSLAQIQIVKNVYPIVGASNVEMVQVLDYHVVCQKDFNIKIGQKVVYVEVDSIVPDGIPVELRDTLKTLTKSLKKAEKGNDLVLTESLKHQIKEIQSKNIHPNFEFLRSKKFKIKALAFNSFGVISEGIIFPIEILKEFDPEFTYEKYTENQDLTELMKIEKIPDDEEDEAVPEMVVKKSKFEQYLWKFSWYRKIAKHFIFKVKGSWLPWFPSESSETNIQKKFSRLKENYSDDGWYVTQKLEGQNISFYSNHVPYLKFFKKRITGVCSHHVHKVTKDNSNFWKAVIKLKFDEKLTKTNGNYFVRGELVGPGICGNIHKLKELDIYLFEVWNIDQKRFLNYFEFIDFCKTYDFKHVPIVDEHFVLPETVQEILDYSNRMVELVPGVPVQSEGVIIRRKDSITNSIKVKSPVYKILHGK